MVGAGIAVLFRFASVYVTVRPLLLPVGSQLSLAGEEFKFRVFFSCFGWLFFYDVRDYEKDCYDIRDE
jgi:hypothetical protein